MLKLFFPVLLVLFGLILYVTNGICISASAVETMSCIESNCPPVCTASGWLAHAAVVVGVVALLVLLVLNKKSKTAKI